jgi:capsule biosynthesis phosphatase
LKIKRFCFDIDGTIAELRKNGETYEDVLPKKDSIETLQRLKSEGHYIILNTARNMETFSSNVGKITAIQGPILFEWLNKHNVPYDEIHFGKPSADYYVDDKAIRLDKWENFEWNNL